MTGTHLRPGFFQLLTIDISGWMILGGGVCGMQCGRRSGTLSLYPEDAGCNVLVYDSQKCLLGSNATPS